MATSWHSSGGPKFYQGTKHETPWNQCIHQRVVNEKENKFMLEIQAGNHSSLSILDTPKPVSTARGPASGATTMRSDVSGALPRRLVSS